MFRTETSRAVRTAAGAMALLLLVLVLFSALYPAAEADHDCCGEHCPVCACIRQCGDLLRGFGLGKASLTFSAAAAVLVFSAAFPAVTAVLRETPVSVKVRLNN